MTCRIAALAVATALCVGAGEASAGDAAELGIIGFAQEGRVFAFEEYGVQDGSGFPYANRFYIDTATDQFLKGSPVRVRIDDEAAGVGQARAQAGLAGEKIVASRQFEAGFAAALNAITEESADPHRIVAQPRPVFPPIDPSVGFRLEEIDFPASADCEAFGPAKGFRLVRFDPATSGDVAVLHEDSRIPGSRNCPLGYRLGGLHTSMEDGVFAVMIAVRAAGFEGPNHRWIAVTGKF